MPECPLPTRLRHTADQFPARTRLVAFSPEARRALVDLLTQAAKTIEQLQCAILQQPPTSRV